MNPGDRVRIIVQNEMDQPTTLHFHGMTVPNGMDGVPYITQDPIMPGEFLTYEFKVVDPPGMYVYHSHFNSTEQVGKGLYGALIRPSRKGTADRSDGSTASAKIDVEYTLFLGDGPLGYVLNGKGFPATQPIVAKLGDWVLIHLANDGALIHPMHLHGYHFEVVAAGRVPARAALHGRHAGGRAGPTVRHPRAAPTTPACGRSTATSFRTWRDREGMFGMVTALVVQ